MLKIKRDTNKQDLKIADLLLVKSEWFSLTWSCGSRQQDTISSGCKFQLNNTQRSEDQFEFYNLYWLNLTKFK